MFYSNTTTRYRHKSEVKTPENHVGVQIGGKKKLVLAEVNQATLYGKLAFLRYL